MGYPVTPSGTPRASAVPKVGSTPTPYVVVDGSASAASKHLLGSADALTEQTRIVFTSSDNVKSFTVHAILDKNSDPWDAMVTVDPGDDITAADRLNSATPDVRLVPGGTSRDFSVADGARSVYVLAIKQATSTATACKGRIWIEGNSHA